MRKIHVITTVINKKKHYVKSETTLANSEVHVQLTIDVTEAKEYQSKASAGKKLRYIRLSFDRIYTAETITVNHGYKQPVAAAAGDRA